MHGRRTANDECSSVWLVRTSSISTHPPSSLDGVRTARPDLGFSHVYHHHSHPLVVSVAELCGLPGQRRPSSHLSSAAADIIIISSPPRFDLQKKQPMMEIRDEISKPLWILRVHCAHGTGLHVHTK